MGRGHDAAPVEGKWEGLRSLRILVVNYEYPPVGGGAGEVSQRLAECFHSDGHDVRVFTSRWGALPRNEVVRGVEIVRHAALRGAADHCTIPRMCAYAALAVVPAWREARRFRPDVVHAHLALPSGLPAFVGHLASGAPLAVTLHGGDVPSTGQLPALLRPVRHLIGPLLRRAALVAAVSDGLASLARRDFPSVPEVRFIANGVDVGTFHPEEERTTDRPPSIVFAGRFHATKNLHVLVDALAALPSVVGGAEWTATLFGDGPERASLEQRIAAAGLRDRVATPGWIDRSRLAAELRVADVFVLPSQVEGMPVTALQAMASGLPVVGTDVCGTREAVADGVTGILVAPGDAPALTAALTGLLADPARRSAFGTAGRARAVEHASWPVIAARYLSEFERVLATCPPRARW